MRGRVIAVFSLVVLLSFELLADCSRWTEQTSVQFRTTALDLSVDGDFLWLATGYGVQLIEDGTIVSSIALPGPTRVVRALGSGYAYAGSGAKVYVLQRQPDGLHLLTSLAVTGNVNDLELAGGMLFAATSSGIVHFDLLDPAAPFRTSVLLPSSSPNVASLASAKNKLYAADGDASVEVYTLTIPSNPQHVGTLASVPFASSVHTTPDDHLFVSDKFGQSTDLFLESTPLARLPLGTNAFATSSAQTHFVAGPDRTIRAIDFSTPARVAERYATSLPPTDGTDNTIHAMARVGDTLYVAAGDIGLVMLDAASLAAPYPLVSYGGGATTSVRVAGDKAWFSTLAGRILQQRVDAGGVALVEERAWDAAVGSVVRDSRDNGLLTTTGATATHWSLVSSTPAQAVNVTFGGAISNAVLSDTSIVALLADGTVWSAPNGSTTPSRVDAPAISLLARSGSAIALAEVRDSQSTTTTVVHYYANGNLAAPAQKFTIAGAAAGGLALDATRAAVFTFNGINIIDLASGTVRIVENSQLTIPRQLAFAGDDLLVMDATRLLVYDDARTLLRNHALPAEGVAFGASSNIAAIASGKGTAALRYLATMPQPEAPFSSAFYTKLAAGSGRAYLFDGESIDIFSTVVPNRPRFLGKISAFGTIDLSAGSSGLFTLAGNGDVTSYSSDGQQLARTNLSQGFDSQMLGVRVVSNGVWVSMAIGCTAQGCRERKTYVLDPSTLATTATLPGSAIDAAVTGNRAYALFSFPDEIRVYDLTDARAPQSLTAVAAPAFASSIAHAAGKVFVLAGRVYGYSDATLAQTEERLTAIASAATHRIRIDGTCALVSRDTEAPALYDLPSWTPSAKQFVLPSPLRSFAVQSGLLLLLTDHSLELEHDGTAPEPRRRAVR